MRTHHKRSHPTVDTDCARAVAFSYVYAILFLAACSQKEVQPTEHTFSIREENGVTIAENLGGPKNNEPLFTFADTVRIQEDESQKESLLVRPQWMGIDEDGMLYVMDVEGGTGKSRILLFDQEGRFVHPIGRSGQGPGEYVAPTIIALQDGLVSVFDRPLNRLSLFSRDGTLVRLTTFTAGKDGLPDRIYTAPDGIQVAIYQFVAKGKGLFRKAVLKTPEGETIARLETPVFRLTQPLRMGNGQWSTESPLNGVSDIEFVPGRGMMYTTGEEPTIEWYDLQGNLSGLFRLNLEKEPVTVDDRALVQSFFEKRWLTGSELGRSLLEEWKKKVVIPRMRGFWNNAFTDENGFLWLEDPRSYFHPTQRTFLIVGPDGEYLGTTFLPQGIPGFSRVSRGHYLRIVASPDLREYELTACRLEPAVEGLIYP